MLEPLLVKVSEFFPNHRKSCIKNVLILALCILLKESVNLYKLKGSVGTVLGNETSDSSSHYKRLIRLFDNYAFSRLWLDLLGFVFSLLQAKVDTLLLDGTSWQSGGKCYHYLTLCIVYEGVAIPIYWLNLHKSGVSNCSERKKLIKKARRHFILAGKTLIADREYLGTDWFKFLLDSKIDFVIRLREKAYKEAINKSKGRSYEELKKKVAGSKVRKKVLKKSFVLQGMDLYFVLFKNPKKDPKEPLVYLITNLDKEAKKIAQTYAIRWKIEHCFKHLKSNGFQLEQINLSRTFPLF